MKRTIVCNRLPLRERPIHRFPLCVTAGLALAALVTSVPGQVHAQVQSSPLKIISPAKWTLDPVCNARNGVNLAPRLQLRNDGSAPLQLALSAAEPVSKTPGKIAVAKIAVTPLDAGDRAATGKTSLLRDEVVRVRVDLTGTLDSGEWEIELRNGGTPVGALTVVIPQVGFGVKLDAATPDKPELTFESGRPATIPLKNEDGFGYRVKGQYSIRGVVKDAEQQISLSPNGGAELRLTPSKEWFASGFASEFASWIPTLFKDDVAEGRLTLRFVSAACPDDDAAPVRVFKVKTTLATRPAEVKDLYGNFVLLITLVLGGICSLALNFFLPANERRLQARAQLSLAARRIGDIPTQTDPRVRNSVAVERRQLAERLRRLKFYHLQFGAEMTEIEQGCTRLGVRLDLIGRMELVLNRYWRQRSVIVSDHIEELRKQLLDLLKRTDPGDGDIQAAQSLISKIEERLEKANTNDPELAVRLTTQILDLKKEFVPTGALATSPIWQNFRTELANEFDKVSSGPTDANNIKPTDYVSLGRAVFIVEQVHTFVKLCGATGATGTLTDDQKALRNELLKDLRLEGWDKLKRAERLVRQVGEGIFYKQVDAEITKDGVVIEPTRPVVRQYEPTEFRVRFLNKTVQNSAAREEYSCYWEFKYANLQDTGWFVSHFFPWATGPEPQPSEQDAGKLRKFLRSVWSPATGTTTSGGSPATGSTASGGAPATGGTTSGGAHRPPYEVIVRFVRDDGHKVPVEITKEIYVRPPLELKVRGSAWVEWLRLVLALGIATVGLVAGAREQILKLDVFPALMAVFLLGFGSDRIKNLFTQRAPSAEESKPPRAG